MDALEGRAVRALAGFRAAIEKIERNGARFHVALVQLDALTLLPEEPAIDDWADAARERFEGVRSPVLLERLAEVVAVRGSATREGAAQH